MRPGNTSPESRPRLLVAPLGWLSALRGPSPVGGGVCPNGVAQSVPVASLLPTMNRSMWCACLSNVCRSPPPRSRLPVWVAALRPHRVKAVPRPGGAWTGAAGLDTLVFLFFRTHNYLICRGESGAVVWLSRLGFLWQIVTFVWAGDGWSGTGMQPLPGVDGGSVAHGEQGRSGGGTGRGRAPRQGEVPPSIVGTMACPTYSN